MLRERGKGAEGERERCSGREGKVPRERGKGAQGERERCSGREGEVLRERGKGAEEESEGERLIINKFLVC